MGSRHEAKGYRQAEMTALQPQIIQSPTLRAIPRTDQTKDFLAAVKATLRHERHGILGPWQYSDSNFSGDPVRGALLWEGFLKSSKDYYPLQNEVRLIHENAARLLKRQKRPVILVDFGPGPRQAVLDKTIPIARIFKDVAGYCPVDISRDYLISACEVVHRENPDILFKAFNMDFFGEDIPLPAGHARLGLFFGSSISNLEGNPEDGIPEEEIIRQLSHLHRVLGEDGALLMAYDANQDEASILQSYLHELQKAFGVNVMHRIKRDLPIHGDFDPYAWKYEPVWHEKTHQLCHTVICERDQSFWLDDERFDIKAGERFILNNSYKYPVQKMREWGEKAGFSRQSHVMDHQNREALHLMAA
jgi:uncharacterized SAM-dependent methyltransferase